VFKAPSLVPAEPLTYSVPEVASLLGINRNTAYELVARGSIPSIRLGKRVLVVRVALERLLESGMPATN
jgi:excisionase family DNA binding protein